MASEMTVKLKGTFHSLFEPSTLFFCLFFFFSLLISHIYLFFSQDFFFLCLSLFSHSLIRQLLSLINSFLRFLCIPRYSSLSSFFSFLLFLRYLILLETKGPAGGPGQSDGIRSVDMRPDGRWLCKPKDDLNKRFDNFSC